MGVALAVVVCTIAEMQRCVYACEFVVLPPNARSLFPFTVVFFSFARTGLAV